MESNSSGGKGSIFITAVIVIVILAAIGSCSGGTSKEYICGFCGKTFTNSADKRSIQRTNLCELCYDNYKFSQELQEELKKYEERYGD